MNVKDYVFKNQKVYITGQTAGSRNGVMNQGSTGPGYFEMDISVTCGTETIANRATTTTFSYLKSPSTYTFVTSQFAS